jgi:tetratricopeptide (TPR) repeat protein
MMISDLLQVAEQHHRAGRRHEAEAICRQLLAQEQDDPLALHLLGILEAQAGEFRSAALLLSRAVQLRPDLVEALANLGCVLVNDRKLVEAIKVYGRLAQLRPMDGGPHYALGILYGEVGRLDEAIQAFSKATELQPDFADAQARLGAALRSQGRFDDAIGAYSRASVLRPDWADARNNLANVLRDKGSLDEAIAQYRAATELKGDDAVIQFNLGNVLFQKERFAEALAPYERALRLKPDYVEAHNMLGLTLASLRRVEEAELAHRRALALRPDDAGALEALGSVLLSKQDLAGADTSFRKALGLAPESAVAWNGLGMVLRAWGRFEEASDCFRRAVAINPDKPSFHRNLISLGAQGGDSAKVGRLTTLLNQPGLPLQERIEAGFALGKLLDDADRFDEAFANFARANALVRETPAGPDEVFDGAKLHRVVDRMIEGSPPAFFARRRDWGEASELPVFIVGMPRSGTTLVEQIAASHPAVHGAGELGEIGRIAAQLSPGERRAAGQGWDAGSIATAARDYLRHVRSLDGAGLRIIDKMPGNIFHLGLIAVLFPAARVIFCRRDARDTCLSCYFQRFANNSHRYTYDLANCGWQWLETDRLMKHWLQVLPLRTLVIHYGELVANQEKQSRRLIDFLGLPWDPACLEFHKTQRPVMTASVWQVRQPMYVRSVGRWQCYERHLEPLLQVLASWPGVLAAGGGEPPEA